MSEPYTPQTDDVRAKFADWYSIYDYRDIAEGWFDRWLDQVKAVARREGQAEAWDEGVTEAYKRGVPRGDMHANNPYRNEEGRHVDQ